MRITLASLRSIAAGLLAVATPLCASNFMGPVYPLPNNDGPASFVGFNNSTHGNGRTGDYSGFNLSDFDEVDWGFYDVRNVQQNSTANTQMSFGGYSGMTGLATWNSTANWIFTDAFHTDYSLPTRFLVQVQPYTSSASTFQGSGFTPQTSQVDDGISSSPQTVAQVTGNFTAQTRFDAFYNGNWTPVGTVYDSVNTDGSSYFTSASAGFYYTTATPEPETWASFASGIGVLFLGRARRRKARG